MTNVPRTVIAVPVAPWRRFMLGMTRDGAFGYAGLVEKRGSAGHELVTPGPRADQLDRRADQVAHPLDVVAAVLGNLLPCLCCADYIPPTVPLLSAMSYGVVVG